MKTREMNLIVYEFAYNYLLKIVPDEIGIDQLDRYFLGKHYGYNSLSVVYEQLIRSAQNYQSMPKVIKYDERKEKIREILGGFDYQRIAAYEVEELYHIFRSEFKVNSPEGKNDSWHKWTKSVIDAAKFMSEFKGVDDFKSFVNKLDENPYTRIALPFVIATNIRGIGFALACDSLKELGYANYPKPDVHLMDVFSSIGLAPKNQILVFDAIVRMAEDCKAFDDRVTPYKIDKVIWLICSGRFHLQNILVGSHKDEFIRDLTIHLQTFS